MRIITNSTGYIQEVSFGAEITCGGQSCVEYTGDVPEGYDSLAAWAVAECERLHRWKIEDGNLVEDTTVADPTENDQWVGAAARFRTTADGRGNVQLFKADGTLAVNAYANTSTAGGEVDVHNAAGVWVGALIAATSGAGVLQLKDAEGNKATLTVALINKLINL